MIQGHDQKLVIRENVENWSVGVQYRKKILDWEKLSINGGMTNSF